MTIIFTDTGLWHWATAPFQEFPVDQKFVKTLFWPDLQIKCEKQNDVSCGEKKKKSALFKFWPAQNLKEVTAYCRSTCHFK